MLKDTEWAYAAARLKVIEKSMISSDKMRQMTDSPSFEEVLRLASDGGYDFSKSRAYEDVFADSLKSVSDMICNMLPDRSIIDIFRLRYDYHNLKCLIKAENLGIECDGSLETAGIYEIKDIKRIFLEKNFKEISPVMANAIKESEEEFSKTKDPQVIDIILDRALYSQMGNMAEKIGSKWLDKLISLYADLNNTRAFIRILRTKKGIPFFKQVFLPQGTISENFFVKLFDKNPEEMRNEINKQFRNADISTDIFNPDNKGGLAAFEKYADDSVMDYIRVRKNSAFGVEPIIGYYLAKINEISNIRIILIGKANDISPELIRERLRKAYA